MRRRLLSILIPITLGISIGAFYVSKPHANMDQVVARALSRHSGIDYIARVVTTTNYSGKTIKAHAVVFHHGATEKVEYPNATCQTVWSITEGGKSYTYLPKTNKLLVSETSNLLSDSDRSALLVKNYRSLAAGTDTVAGRNVYVVKIMSRYDGRPIKKLWIDKEYLTVLKSIDYSVSGEERGETDTKEISYGVKIARNAFDSPISSSVKTITVCESGRSMDLFSKLAFSVKLPLYMPPGYKLEGYHLFYSQCNCHHCSALLTYTDGLNLISVFQAPKTTCCTDGSCNMADCGRNGKGCAVTDCDIAKTGQLIRGEKSIVVVGDLLPDEVKKIAESVK